MLRMIYGVTTTGLVQVFDPSEIGVPAGRDGIQHAWLYFDDRHDAEAAASFIRLVEHLKEQLDVAMKEVLKIGPECESSVEALRKDFTTSAVAFVEQYAAVQTQALEQVEREDTMKALAKQPGAADTDDYEDTDIPF